LENLPVLAKRHTYLTVRTSDNMVHVFQRLKVLGNTFMKKKKPINYLRSHRQRWGFSQRELANLFGWSRSEVISRIEQKKRLPNLKLIIACFILFGVPVADMFPDIADRVDAIVMAGVWEMYEKIQGNSSKRTKKKIELLESAIARAKLRKPAFAV
jgi:DNA-binding XRE family transcriptional regulator